MIIKVLGDVPAKFRVSARSRRVSKVPAGLPRGLGVVWARFRCRTDLKMIWSGGIFRGRSASDIEKLAALPKRLVLDDKLVRRQNFFQKCLPKKIIGVEKQNAGNCLKRVLPKFRADRSHPREVNGSSKFR